MSKFQQLYVKYLIKKPVLFYGFIGLFLTVFIGIALSINLDIMESYAASISGNIITIEGICAEKIKENTVYYYINRNENIYTAEATDIRADAGNLSILINNNNQGELSGAIGVDLIVGKQTLLARIFVNTGKN